ncbi:lipopolysaccharide assembly protein LapA domain-containing protein [Desulfonatronum sp. SC1]|uniref:lipopolysaccharide assembly protein LapA domain-containing protein n=1 Tax=Desulfonatronum sp. SC1 TaxID=2109626 RepID=UPI000D3116FB|nr:lipopolysaccharide assembly protein LapA domain-containing protein [Desulfonatronum sp. SC1]PTN35604.1 hypothetical protein C6366_10940 [Desulfonatronum sp. SC1]
MKHVKILFFLLFCVAIAMGAVQNAEILSLSPAPPMVVHWPGLLSVEFSLPFFVLIPILFAAGFMLTSLSYLSEHFRLKRSVAESKRELADLESELSPEPEPESKPDLEPDPGQEPKSDSSFETTEPEEQRRDSSATWRRGAVAAEISSTESSSQTLQITMESTMEKTSSTPETEEKLVSENDERNASGDDNIETSSTAPFTASGELQSPAAPQADDASAATGKFKEDEVLERPSGPGWGAVLFLSAALALVVSSGVYIVLNSQVSKMAEQLGDLHIQSGHMASTQEEMGRILELERVAVRDELESLGQGQKQLGAGVENLEEQMLALQALPEIVRKQLVAGFLRDTAGKTAFLGSQVETEEQRETLERVEEMLQSLAKELENTGEGR